MPMLRKIIKVRNVGKLQEVRAAGDVELRPITLVWAENARGKTTLCDILRSLATGNPEYVLGRKTLASPEEVEVQIALASGMAIFSNGKWNCAVPQIGVFDDTFVADNVYAGYHVDHEHRRNLYRVIIGEEGIRLARAVDDLDQEIRTADGAIREKEQALRRFIPAYLTTNDFLCLPEDHDIDERISRSAREIESAQQAEEIGRKAELVVLSLPTLPARLHELLTKTLADIALDAEVRVREHLAQHTNAAKESWAQEGIGYILGDTCPFCAQSLQGVDLIDAYRAYFSRTYRELQANLHSLRTEIQRLTTDIPVLQLERAKEANANLAEFWRRFLAFDLPEIDVTEVGGGLRAAAVGAMSLVDQKLERPLEAVQIGPDFSAAQEGLDLARTSILAYNNAVAVANALIRQQKAAVQTARLSELQAVHGRLLARRARHQAENRSIVEAYLIAAEHKASLQKRKTAAKDALDAYTAEIFRRFEGRINELLDRFGATFRIGGTNRSYHGGKPSSSYQLVINDVSVDVGRVDTPLGQASFRNTLSAGDRSALALAFFVASAELEPQLSERVLVIDDPFSSQDRSRRTATQQTIRRLATRSAQMVVLSHDKRFLRDLWDKLEPAQRRALQVARISDRCSTISEWNIETETTEEYFQRVNRLKSYRDEGEGSAREIVALLRPVLEESLRYRFPGSFPAAESLGDYIGRIRNCDAANPISALQRVLGEYEDLNDYSVCYYHADGTPASAEEPNPSELASYVRLTLQLVNAY